MQDVDSVNPVELPDAVLELKQRDVVHCHPERIVSAQDLHLEQSGTQSVTSNAEREVALQAVIYDFFIELSLLIRRF